MVMLFGLTMFISATLLFIVQPMVAKLLLPSLGGSAAVWTTCMLFFQAALLAGYAYAHLGARWLSPRRQVLMHIPLMLLAVIALPFGIPELSVDPSHSPTTWLLAVLLIGIGLPFVVVSASAPLLQHFFAQTDHPDADDPYFLYGASNLGSMVALIGYPTIVEPLVGVGVQTKAWSVLYVALIVLVVACARTVFGSTKRMPVATTEAAPLTWRQRARWVALAAVPSSLMLGVTAHMTTDLAPVPLLWVLPLALYLGTFVLVFGRRPVLLGDGARIALPILILVGLASGRALGPMEAVGVHLLMFFGLTLFLHGTLARERPHAARLTEYFLWLSVGGVAGGVFNAIIAPLVFNQLIEYAVVMCLAVASIAVPTDRRHPWLVAVVAALSACLYLWAHAFAATNQWVLFLIYFTTVLVVVRFLPRWQNVALALVLAAGSWAQFTEPALRHDRSFFASYKVHELERGDRMFRYLRHGTTVHGVQATDAAEARVPRSYHHPDGPVGEVLRTVEHESVLVVGLGVGAMAAYARPGLSFDFYEIDPLVHELAEDWFSYLSTCGDRCEVFVGDGRRLLARSSKSYDLIVLDAYNSSGVPTHLLTREAVELYLEHLDDDGLLLFNVSNRYVEVDEVVGTLCADAGLHAYERTFDPSWRRANAELIDSSQFIVASPNPAVLEPFAAQPEIWKPPPTMDAVWTDDYTNLLRVVRW